MIVYVDASVLLRVALRQRGQLPGWSKITTAVASALVRLECLRALDRLRLMDRIDDRELVERREVVQSFLSAIHLVAINDPILARAAEPLPSVLGSLDAIHLATALLWREEKGQDLTVATHDAALGTAVRAYGFAVIGV